MKRGSHDPIDSCSRRWFPFVHLNAMAQGQAVKGGFEADGTRTDDRNSFSRHKILPAQGGRYPRLEKLA